MSLIRAACVTSLLLIAGTTCTAQQLPKGLTAQQKQKLDRYIVDYVKAIRVKEPRPQPPMVEAFNRKYTEQCRKRAEAEYKRHGRWFYCEDKKEFRGHIRWDEVVTYRVYWQLYARYGSLEKIPNYSDENHKKAIAFWKKWQKEDGSFYNFFTGQGSGPGCNGKYIPSIMQILGCRPVYATSGYGAAEVNVGECLDQISKRQMNHGTATLSVMMKEICDGKSEYIPVVERGVELAVAHLSRHTGMFHGREGKGGDWAGYGTTAETMKGMLRLIGYMGVENIPFRHVRADTLIENQGRMREGAVSVKRNTSEMMVQCLLESPYRGEELLGALEGHSKVILEGNPAENHKTGDYAAYVLMIFGPYLNWEGYDGRAPRTPFPTGAQYDYRVVVGPFGRCANVVKKRPEERLWHEGWAYEKHGLRARNTEHENREVIDVVPASAEGWAKTTDDEGRVILTRTFTLEKTDLENPHLKIKFSGGDIEILLNGVLVKKKLAGLADYGAVHIPDAARKTLRKGDNTLVVRSVGKTDRLDVGAGLIDWR